MSTALGTRCTALLAIACVATLPSIAQGQYAGPDGYLWNNPVSASAALFIQQSIMSETMGLGANAKQRLLGDTAKRRSPSSHRQPGGTTAFTPRRHTVLDQFTGTRRDQATKLLDDCQKVYAKTLALTGAAQPSELNDLSTSTAFYFIIAHYIYWQGQSQVPADPQPAHFQTLRNKLRVRYVSNGSMIGKSDTEKQAAHDSLVLSACIPMVQFTQAKKANSEPGKQTARKAAADLLTRLGLSPNAMRFQPDGTVLIRGID